MKLNPIKNFFSKIIARQLRRPSGILAGRVGNEMNKTNGFLYDFTIGTMELADNESILEIGFGNGRFFDRIFSKANNLKISGLDFSSEMVKVAAENNPLTTADGKLTLRFGSSDKIPFPDNSFDKIFCINVVYFWEQPADHLKEIFRVLKPGGTFYTSIRSKESLEQMPFSKYGFTIYLEEQWIHILEGNFLHFVCTKKTKNEPDVEVNNRIIKAESLCIVAKKQ